MNLISAANWSRNHHLKWNEMKHTVKLYNSIFVVAFLPVFLYETELIFWWSNSFHTLLDPNLWVCTVHCIFQFRILFLILIINQNFQIMFFVCGTKQIINNLQQQQKTANQILWSWHVIHIENILLAQIWWNRLKPFVNKVQSFYALWEILYKATKFRAKTTTFILHILSEISTIIGFHYFKRRLVDNRMEMETLRKLTDWLELCPEMLQLEINSFCYNFNEMFSFGANW